MAILIKCNESDIVAGDEQIFTLRTQKGLRLATGQEAFIWVSELPREGRPRQPGGLRMRGEVIDWSPAGGGRATVHVRISEQLTQGLGMGAFAANDSDAARNLHRSIGAYRHCRIGDYRETSGIALMNVSHAAVRGIAIKWPGGTRKLTHND